MDGTCQASCISHRGIPRPSLDPRKKGEFDFLFFYRVCLNNTVVKRDVINRKLSTVMGCTYPELWLYLKRKCMAN